jgi:TonB family protein
MRVILFTCFVLYLSSICFGQNQTIQKVEKSEPLILLKKPKPKYTKQARKNKIEGEVRLHVIFSATDQIGDVKLISGLGYGLDERAIEAAKQIKFIAAKRNGVSISIIKPVIYVFQL